MHPTKCLHCGNGILADRRDRGARYCGPACKQAAKRKKSKILWREGVREKRQEMLEKHVAEWLKKDPRCGACGEAITSERLRQLGRVPRFCSETCAVRAQRTKAPYDTIRRECVSCGKLMELPKQRGRPLKWCEECRGQRTQPATKNGWRRYTPVPAHERAQDLSGVSWGAALTKLVVAHLTMQGFFVYEAASPDAPFDLVRSDGVELLRVEVRSGSAGPTERPVFMANRETGKTDLYAVVMPDNSIVYLKEEPPAPGGEEAGRVALPGSDS